MLNRRGLLNSIASLPIFNFIKSENSVLVSDELKAKAELWDLFISVGKRVILNGVIYNPRIGAKVEDGKEPIFSVEINGQKIESESLEEVYSIGLLEFVKVLDKNNSNNLS